MTAVRPASPATSWVRELSGTLVAGLVVFAVGLFVAWAVAASAGAPGPGLPMLLGHPLGAAAAVALHRVALRRADRIALVAALAVSGVLMQLGVLLWWG